MSLLRDAWRHAPTHHRVWALAGPMILSNVSVPLVHLVDSTVVGHLPHAYQLGAVAVGGSLYTLMVGVLGFLRMGTTGFAAQAAGRDDGGALRLILAQGLGMALLLALLLGALALPLSGWALQLMQPSAELTGEARAFFHTRLLGLPAALASYALVGWFLGTQNARAPLAILLTTNLSNIALVLWFVHGLDWGVQGAARASVLAEWSGALLGLALTRRDLARRPGRAQWQRLRHWLSWLPLLMVNRDIFIRSLALQLVFFLLTVQGTRLGDATVAANALLLNGLLLTSYALDGLAHAVEALCGHATLAAAHVLFEVYDEPGERLEFISRSGALRVNREDERLVLDFPAQYPSEVGSTVELEQALGLPPVDVLGSTDKLLVLLESEEAVRACRPDFAALARLPWRGVIVTARGLQKDFVSRFFAPAMGVDEDPVTGSAHCSLIPYWAQRLNKLSLTAQQCSARGGELWCRLEGERVSIAGHAVLVASGRIRLS
ncbi:hypothetical protein ALP65_00957 [Pseudomonas aeruginosa]|uniref:Uncharacterized protein n=63 Tax=Gammaproteobacteria TaxID=1236 RepID=A0A3M5DUI8_PSEAI|nr:hypothetical protein ALP65_00957 [Pseudomonas aeruginosa]